MTKFIYPFLLGASLLVADAKASDRPLDYFLDYFSGFSSPPPTGEELLIASWPYLNDNFQTLAPYSLWKPELFTFLSFDVQEEDKNDTQSSVIETKVVDDDESSSDYQTADDLIYGASTLGISMATMFGAGVVIGLTTANSIIGFNDLKKILKGE